MSGGFVRSKQFRGQAGTRSGRAHDALKPPPGRSWDTPSKPKAAERQRREAARRAAAARAAEAKEEERRRAERAALDRARALAETERAALSAVRASVTRLDRRGVGGGAGPIS